MSHNTVFKEYLELKTKNHNATHLKVEVYYDLGGMNYFTYTVKKRGYYISVTPVTYSKFNGMIVEGCTAFTGVYQLVKEVSRKSAKAANEAVELSNRFKKTLIDHVLKKQGIELADAFE